MIKKKRERERERGGSSIFEEGVGRGRRRNIFVLSFHKFAYCKETTDLLFTITFTITTITTTTGTSISLCIILHVINLSLYHHR